MKKPTLRLRQVFEGPTHFKVVKPLGNPIKIAKKGLSPNLMGRLRKFARNGEVPEPVEATGDERAIDFETPVEAPIAPLPRAPTLAEIMARPEFVTTQEAVGVPVETIKASDVEQAPVIVPVAPPMTTAAMPRMVATTEAQRMGPPAPVAPVMQRAAEPQEEPVVEPVVAAPVRRSPGFAPEIPGAPGAPRAERIALASSLDQINAMIGDEISKAEPDMDRLARLTAESERLAAAAPAPVTPAVPTVATPAAAVRVVPVRAAAAPAVGTVPATAPVAPTPLAAVTAVPAAPPAGPVLPKGFDPAKPLTVDLFREMKQLNKGMTDEQAASALIRAAVPDAPEVLPDLDKLALAPPVGADEDTLKRFDDAKAKLVGSIIDQAKVDREAAQALVVANEKAQAQRLINAERDRAEADALKVRRDNLRAAVEGGFSPTSYFESVGLAGQIGTALSLAAGAFATGMTGMPNYAMKIYSDAVERDLDIQKGKYNSLVNQYNRLLGDAEDAEKLARADLNDLAALQVEAIKARSTVRGIAPAAERMIAELQAKAERERAEVAIKAAEAREADVKAKMAEELNASLINQRNAAAKRATASAAAAGLSKGLGAERLEFAKAKWLEGRKFSVPDPADPSKSIYINAPTPAIAKEKVGEITQRITGLMQLEDFESWLKENANKPVTPDSIKEMQVKVAGIVENYPGTVRGSKNLVTVAQSKLLKPAITSTNIPIIQFMDVLGLTTTAMKEIRADANRGVSMSVRGAASEGDPGLAEFKSKFTAQGYRGRGPYGESAGAAMPPLGKARVRAADGKIYVIDRAKLADALKVPGVTEVP